MISLTFIAKGLANFGSYWVDLNTNVKEDWLKDNVFWYPLLMSAYFISTEIIPTILLCIGVRNVTNRAQGIQEPSGEYNLGITQNTNLNSTLSNSLDRETTISWTGEDY